jgi:hypothetical protein
MKAMREASGQPLAWSHPGVLTRGYDLLAGDDVVATLRWEKIFGSLATAVTAEGSWTFKRGGFLSPRVTVRIAGAETDLASLKARWCGDGTLEFADGRRYRWTHAGFWRTEWFFASESGDPLMRLTPKFALLGHAADVKIEPAAASIPDLTLLLTLAWYLVVLMSQDAGGATAAVVAASA